jgi:hypothetical protein
MGIEPTRRALPGLENKGFAALANAKCEQRVNLSGMWGQAKLRRDTLMCEPGLQPFSRASPIGPEPALLDSA